MNALLLRLIELCLGVLEKWGIAFCHRLRDAR